MRKPILYIVLFLELALIASLGRGLWETLQSRQRIDALRQERDVLLHEQERLKSELALVESDYYIDHLARDTLHLSKPGETLVIVDRGAIPAILGVEEERSLDDRANWQKWWDVLFGRE